MVLHVEKKPVRVLIVDDSAYNRKTIADMLATSADIEVVGKAIDGDDALRLAASLRPDVITLDLEMPRMDGFTFLRILMSRQPIPVLVISSYHQKENVFKALELGAIDFIAKPNRQVAADGGELRHEIVQKVLLVRNLRPTIVAREVSKPNLPPPAEVRAAAATLDAAATASATVFLVGIASSTGGPTALLEIFGRLPARLAAAVVIAQHMPDKFTRTFAERLDKKGAFRVSEAYDGAPLSAGAAFVCPGRQCMEILTSSRGCFRLRTGAPGSMDRYIPSADRLFRSLATAAGPRAIAVVLTGMGDDGVLGARAVRDAGGTVLVECQESAVVFGMPGSVIRAGLANHVLTLAGIVEFLSSYRTEKPFP